MGGSPSSELDGFSAALAALAARAAEWIYEPDPRQRPLPWVLTLGEQTAHLRYKQRQLLNRDGTNSVRKATFVATLELSGERKRVFVLAFQGTSSDKDWLTNLGVERNRRAFARLGLAVHSGWAATIDSDFHFSAMKAGLEEEAKSEGGIDAVLLCGHSLGGAIAQIAAMFLYNEALADENLQKWTQCLHCYTFGAPTPFSLPEEAELQAEAKAALEWMQEKCLNFVNNNDPVPRLPGNLQFAQRFLQKSPLFALADFFTNIAARAQKVQEEGYLQTYQPVVSTQLVGHARPREGVRVKAGAAGAAKLSEEQRADPAAGCSEVNVAADHPVRTYVNKVYRSVHVADHLYGQEDALVWQEVPLENGSYRGQVSRGKLSGAGVAKWADDSRYEGQWQEGSMQGLGAFTKPDGSCYQGQWAAGCTGEAF